MKVAQLCYDKECHLFRCIKKGIGDINKVVSFRKCWLCQASIPPVICVGQPSYSLKLNREVWAINLLTQLSLTFSAINLSYLNAHQ